MAQRPRACSVAAGRAESRHLWLTRSRRLRLRRPAGPVSTFAKLKNARHHTHVALLGARFSITVWTLVDVLIKLMSG